MNKGNNINHSETQVAFTTNGIEPLVQYQLDGQDTPLLEAIHLHKEFPIQKFGILGAKRAVHAVEDTSLTLRAGRAIALVGESGSGKTTVARILSGMYQPTSGTMRFRGETVHVKGERALRNYRRNVQLIFQDPFASLNSIHTVRYHLSRPLRLHGHVHNDQEEEAAILSLLERVSLYPAEQYIEKLPHQLSGGQRQRVAIARALAVQPSVLLADEPVSMLDVSIRLDMLNLLLSLKEQEHLGILFITHDLASARYFAEDTLVMYAGQTVEGGPSDEIIQRPKHPYTQLLLSAAPDPDNMKTGARPSIERVAYKPTKANGNQQISLINPPQGCRFHLRCPHVMDVCRQRFPGKTNLGNGHWTNCFLYGDGDQLQNKLAAAMPSANKIQEDE